MPPQADLPEAFACLGDNRVNVDRLIRQLRTGGVIPFVGAGMSVPFKFPQWKEFLIGNAPGRPTRAHIGRLVDAGKYEEAAAVLLRARGSNGLQDIIEATFGSAAPSETPADAAVLLLPDLCSGPVLTTNFDAVLEKTFQGANRPFDGVIVGMLVDDLRRALQERSRVLVHLHGVATDRTSRVLTMQDYRRWYANAAPLEGFLRVVVTQPVLFLGCSLNNDRPVRVLRKLWSEMKRQGVEAFLRHYAVLEYPASAKALDRRRLDLERMGVSPIWYPRGQHALIRDLLAFLVEQAGQSTVSSAASSYAAALFASFRLDGGGLAVDGAMAHARALARAYAGTNYLLNQTRLTINDLAASTSNRIVLQGAAGSGKSVTLKQLLVEASRRESRLPIYLRLATFAADVGSKNDVPHSLFLRSFADRARGLGVPELTEQVFERALATGRAAVALDGFDEIGGRAARERVARLIGEFSDAYKDVRLLVASRPAEYAATPLPAPTADGVREFVEVSTLPFESAQVRAFLRECFNDDGTLWRTIERDRNLARLAQSPLMLTLIALLAKRGPLPAGRADLYEAVVTTALDTWEASKGLAEVTGAKKALEDLAFAMHQRETPAAPLPSAHALRVVGGARGDLFAWLVDRSGLVLRHEERGAATTRGVVQFAHLQLQEYLAGRALARELATNGDRARAILERWKGTAGWFEVMQFAAAVLAREGAFEALESWVVSRTVCLPQAQRNEVLLTAYLLAEADAEFLPAEALEREIVSAISSLPSATFWDREDRIYALCALVPRPASLVTVREIALQTPAGLKWLDRTTPLPEGSPSTDEDMLAACMQTFCAYAGPEDLKQVVDWVLASAHRLQNMSTWTLFAGDVERVYGPDRMRQYLRDLTFSDQWLTDAHATDVVNTLNTIALVASPELAFAFATEGVDRSLNEVATAGFAMWLDGEADPAAFGIADRYYDALRDRMACHDSDIRWMSALPLWPERDSPSTEALRLEVLRHRDLAWFVMPKAIRSPKYYNVARAAWLDIVRDGEDRSRSRSLVYDMCHEPDTSLSTPLLLDALGSWRVDRWSGTMILETFRTRGCVDAAAHRLTATWNDPTTTPEHRADLERLLQFAAVPFGCAGQNRRDVTG